MTIQTHSIINLNLGTLVIFPFSSFIEYLPFANLTTVCSPGLITDLLFSNSFLSLVSYICIRVVWCPQEITKKYFNKNSSNEKHVILSNYLIKNPFIPQTQREIILKTIRLSPSPKYQ